MRSEIEKKTKKVTFRASEAFVEFLDELSKTLKMERSDIIRNIIGYFVMGNALHKFDMSYKELSKKFMEDFVIGEKASKNLKK